MCNMCVEPKFPKPIQIQPRFIYKIKSTQNPPENCAIGSLLKT